MANFTEKDIKVDNGNRPQNTSNTVSSLLGKFKNKNRMLSTDNFFLVDIKVNDSDNTGRYSLFADKFEFQLFKMESDIYTIGYQDISYLKNINIMDTFVISLKENPNNTIGKLIYDYIFSLVKNNKSRILTEYDVLFDDVYVHHYLDTINKHNGNHFIYHFEDCKLISWDKADATLDFNGANLVDKELKLKFNKVTITYYDMDLKTKSEQRTPTYTTYTIDLVNNKFENKKFTISK